jgi:hypothetical protein
MRAAIFRAALTFRLCSVVNFMGPVERMWPVLSRLMNVHTAVYRATGGRVGHRLPRNPPTLLIDHVSIQVRSQRRAVHAHVASRDERTGLWPKVVAAYGGYDGYQRRTEREIPVVVLEPSP